ncbi:CLIP domain-containing serine protease 14D-like [Photinus pyralis]|uniref:CLIP domain-containing serine protease 14D-like n=1 Tax=Photinus pyralis TaxID=7054 RepID=UPI00126718D6|nr:CLIP domain-containing serine protease 14D-like [Photinus pyralis]
MCTATFRVSWLSIITWLLAFDYLKSETLSDYTDCRTLTKEAGLCISIKECKPLLNYLSSVPVITPEISKRLHEYHCGFKGKDVQVCCPSNGVIYIGDHVNDGDSITKHKNFHLLPKDCGLSVRDRLLGGNIASLFEVPWMALLSYETPNGTEFRCSGSVINNRYILTSAHCLSKNREIKLKEVRCGEHNLNTLVDCEGEDVTAYNTKMCAPPVQDIGIEEIIAHPGYNLKSFTNDIGLIRLERPLNVVAENVQPICLPVYTTLKNTTRWFTVTSWGLTGVKSAELHKITNEIVSQEQCQKAYAPVLPMQINEDHLCATQKHEQICYGNSGDPLQIETILDGDIHNVQYGIFSFGPRSCRMTDFPYVFTRVESHLKWILDNLKA